MAIVRFLFLKLNLLENDGTPDRHNRNGESCVHGLSCFYMSAKISNIFLFMQVNLEFNLFENKIGNAKRAGIEGLILLLFYANFNGAFRF